MPDQTEPLVIVERENHAAILTLNRPAKKNAMSDALLEDLFQGPEDPAHTYEHLWTPGDLVMWDNLCTLHARTWFDPSMSRVLRRTSVAGEAPRPAFSDAA